jgi:hypothetical protein
LLAVVPAERFCTEVEIQAIGFKFFDRNEQITEQKKRQKAESAQQHLVITLGFSKSALLV